MYHFATAFIAVIVATVLVSGSAEAAKMSKAETVACKAEAKAKKFSWHWLKRRKYVQNCIVRTAKQEGVRVNVWQVRSLVNMKDPPAAVTGGTGLYPGVLNAEPRTARFGELVMV